MPSKKRKKGPVNLYRWAFTFLLFLFFYYLHELPAIEEILAGDPPRLYSGACSDDLEKLYLEAIEGAQHSISLNIYSLSDRKIINILNKKGGDGVNIKIKHDLTTPTAGFQKLSDQIHLEGIKISGLMHEKILVVDGERLWLGSANLTTESLKLHDNLVVGVVSPQLAKAITERREKFQFQIKEQTIEFWRLPEKGKEGLERVVQALSAAKSSVRVAMYTWTNAKLTEAVIAAKKRGVKVEIILDRGQALGVCRPTFERLVKAGIHCRLNSGLGLLHHKFAWIDEELLINGSANWTVAAFTRNHDCFLCIYPLTSEQKAKMEEIWRKTFRLAHDQVELFDLAA